MSQPARLPLPPKALLLSLLAQAPAAAMFAVWPPRPLLLALGMCLAAAGVILNVWSVRLFRVHGAGVCPFSPLAGLVHRGPYRFSRNPMYLGIVAISGGVALASGAPIWNLAPSAALTLYLHFAFVLREEDFLIERLGSAYLRYAARTPRWCGLPGRRVSSHASESVPALRS